MIVFDHVAKAYQEGGAFAIFDVSFSVREGELIFICGDSGAGKSTMIKLMTGEIKPTRGSVTVNGVKIEKLKERRVPHFRRTLGVVYQDFRLIQNKTAEENVAFAMRVLGASPLTIRRRVEYVMDLVGLNDKLESKPGELSGGEQQRVAIARALVNNPSIIIADEPTGNLDPQRSYEIMELLYRINSLGTTVVVITHDYELLRRFAPRVIYMQKGLLAADRVMEHPPVESVDRADEELINPETTGAGEEEIAFEEAVIPEEKNPASEDGAAKEAAQRTIPPEVMFAETGAETAEEPAEEAEKSPEEAAAEALEDAARKGEFIPREEFVLLPCEELPTDVEVTREERHADEPLSLEEDWARMLESVDGETGKEANE